MPDFLKLLNSGIVIPLKKAKFTTEHPFTIRVNSHNLKLPAEARFSVADNQETIEIFAQHNFQNYSKDKIIAVLQDEFLRVSRSASAESKQLFSFYQSITIEGISLITPPPPELPQPNKNEIRSGQAELPSLATIDIVKKDLILTNGAAIPIDESDLFPDEHIKTAFGPSINKSHLQKIIEDLRAQEKALAALRNKCQQILSDLEDS